MNDYLGKYCEVYFNLHKRLFSVRRKGLVVAHARNVKVVDPKFVVQPAGRARVLREKKKNVHAFVRGYVTHTCDDEKCLGGDNWSGLVVNVTYNPYRQGYFYVKETGQQVASADMALLELTDRNSGKITGFFKE